MKFNTVLIFIFAFSLIFYTSLAQHSPEYPTEQTYLSVSQPYYLSGNTLHYVVYLFDPETGRKETPSNILSTELLAPSGSLIFHHIHSMNLGSSPGSYVLPDTLRTGCYWLRAYTRYQVDYTEHLIHYLPVYVIHPDDIDDPGILKDNLDNPKNIPETQPEDGVNQDLPLIGPSTPNTIRVDIREGKRNQTIRETVSLTVKITDQSGKPVSTRLSFLVRDLHQFNAGLLKPQSLPEYRSFQGNTFTYQVGNDRVTNGRAPGSVKSFSERTTQPKYPPQNELKLIGKYVDPDLQENLSFRAISLTQTGQRPGFTLLFTALDGSFEFNRLNFSNRENQLVLNAGINQGIVLEDEWISPAFRPPAITGNLTEAAAFRQYLTMRERDLKYKKFYHLAGSMVEDSGQVDISRYRIYEKADRSYDLDDYIELTDMREVIIELLPNVKIYRDDDQTRIKIFYHGNVDILPDPLFLVNGRIVKDNDFILNMDNRNVDKIEVLFKESSLEPFGPLGIGGVVAIYTKTPVSIPYGMPVDFMGYHEPEEKIVQFDPKKAGSGHFPDFNPLLYWDPVFVTDQEGKGKISFYTNDLASDFDVIVEGITPEGIPFYHTGRMSVTKPMNP